MKAFVEVVELKYDVVTASQNGGCTTDDGCNGCDLGCPNDTAQMGGDL